MKDSINYYFAVETLKNYDKNELINLYNSTPKNWNFYGPASKNTLWILPIEIELFYKTDIGNSIQSEYIDSVAFMLIKPNGRITPHVDTRPTSFLFPVMGDFENSALSFYDDYINKKVISLTGNSEGITKSSIIYQVGDPSLTLSYNYPVIINSQIIHSIKNPSDKERITLSVTLKRNLSYNEVFDLYNLGKLVSNGKV
jgi:hypothetical protein